jgi:hypothetical protein
MNTFASSNLMTLIQQVPEDVGEALWSRLVVGHGLFLGFRQYRGGGGSTPAIAAGRDPGRAGAGTALAAALVRIVTVQFGSFGQNHSITFVLIAKRIDRMQSNGAI